MFLFSLFIYSVVKIINWFPITLRGEKLGVVCLFVFGCIILINLEYIRRLLCASLSLSLLKGAFSCLSPSPQSGFLILVLGMMMAQAWKIQQGLNVQQLACTPHVRTVPFLSFCEDSRRPESISVLLQILHV